MTPVQITSAVTVSKAEHTARQNGQHQNVMYGIQRRWARPCAAVLRKVGSTTLSFVQKKMSPLCSCVVYEYNGDSKCVKSCKGEPRCGTYYDNPTSTQLLSREPPSCDVISHTPPGGVGRHNALCDVESRAGKFKPQVLVKAGLDSATSYEFSYEKNLIRFFFIVKTFLYTRKDFLIAGIGKSMRPEPFFH